MMTEDDARVVRWSTKRRSLTTGLLLSKLLSGEGKIGLLLALPTCRKTKKNTILRSRTLFCRSDSIIRQ